MPLVGNSDQLGEFIKLNEKGFDKRSKLSFSTKVDNVPLSSIKEDSYKPNSFNKRFLPDSIGTKIYGAFRKSKSDAESFAYSFYPCQTREPIIALIVGLILFMIRFSFLTLVWVIQILLNIVIK